MKSTICFLLFALAVLCPAQEQAVPAPPEMKMADFMLGEWTNSESVVDGGKKFDYTFRLSITKALGDRYLLVKHVHNDPGQQDVEGMHMLKYDPVEKLWRAWWFISTESAVTELSGNFENDKLVMISKPFKTGAVPGDVVLRASWQATAEKGLRFLMDFKQGDTWTNLIDRTYKKA